MAPPRKEINVWVMGESGVGKSTTLAALASYLRFDTFEDALKSIDTFRKFQVLPAQFEWDREQNDEQSDELVRIPIDIKGKMSTSAENSSKGYGSSVTESPTAYTMDYGAYTVRFIDTPGWGDTAGDETNREVDKTNFENVLSYIHNLEELHAVLIMLSSATTRVHSFYKYCFEQILLRLPKSVKSNVIFCLTNSPSLRRGNGFSVIKNFFTKEVPDLVESLNKVYAIDNDGYRFLLAKSQYPDLEEPYPQAFSRLWNGSAQQLKQMMDRLVQMKPTNIAKTGCINSVIQQLQTLMGPIVDIQKKYLRNEQEMNEQLLKLDKTIKDAGRITTDKKDEIHKTIGTDIDPMKDAEKMESTGKASFGYEMAGNKLVDLDFKIDILCVRKLSSPGLVCTNCLNGQIGLNGRRASEDPLCYKNCDLSTGQKIREFFGFGKDYRCVDNFREKFSIIGQDASGRYCAKCEYHYYSHKLCTEYYYFQKTSLKDLPSMKDIVKTGKSKDLSEQAKAANSLTVFKNQLKDEFDEIKNSFAKIGAYLCVNTISGKFSQAFLDKVLSSTSDTSENFQKFKTETLEKVNSLCLEDEHGISEGDYEIPEITKKLFRLKHFGPQLRNAVETIESTKELAFKQRPNVVLFSKKHI